MSDTPNQPKSRRARSSAIRSGDPVPAPKTGEPQQPYRLTDYPMHYFAAIQRQNQLNLARALREFGLSVPMWRALSALASERRADHRRSRAARGAGSLEPGAAARRNGEGEAGRARAAAGRPARARDPAVGAWPQDLRGDAAARATPLPRRAQGRERAGIRDADAGAAPDQGEHAHDGGRRRSGDRVTWRRDRPCRKTQRC